MGLEEQDAGPNGPQPSSRARRRLTIVAALGAMILSCAAIAAPDASARTISITELGRLHLTSHHGFTLNEEGQALGTIAGKIYIHLHVTSTNHVSAEVSIYPRGGSVTGYASASYRSAGALASFNGTMSVARGTGTWSRAHASGLSFSGTVARSNDAVTVRVTGKLSS